MICELHRRADGAGALILCGVRPPRKRCAFCLQRAVTQCDGDRCTHPICDDHRWEARPELHGQRVSVDFCPSCEVKLMAGAKLPVQIWLFG
jgi:hypothetical protein